MMDSVSSKNSLYSHQKKGAIHSRVDQFLNQSVYRPTSVRPEGFLRLLNEERRTLIDLGAVKFDVSMKRTGETISALYIKADIYREKLEELGVDPLSKRLVFPLPIQEIPRTLSSPKTAILPPPAGAVYETSHRMISNMLDRGYDVLTFNYPGLGESGGISSEENFYESVKTIYTAAINDLNIPQEELFGVGTSLGGATILSLVNIDPSIPLILDRTFSDFPTVAAAKVADYPIVRSAARWFINRYIQFDSKSLIAKAEGNIWIIRAKEDKLIPHDCADILFKSAVKADKVCLINLEGAHSSDDGLLWMHDEKSQKKFEFLLNNLFT